MQKQKIFFITQAAIIAALYVVITYIVNLFGLANGAVQLRLSEALTILPVFTPAAIPGIAIGCFLSNILTGCAFYDIVFGSLASLIGAIGTYLLRKFKWLAPVPPIAANTLIIPWVLLLVYQVPGTLPYHMLTVGIGEVLSCGVCGLILLSVLNRYKNVLFPDNTI